MMNLSIILVKFWHFLYLHQCITDVIIMPTEKPRYCITVDDETLKEIDDFRFENRYNSRSKATLELIRMGLESLKTNEKDNLKK